ncbi:toll/interleukin-1 receptor domain-containing protein [Mastigocladus laminosus UU774]|nr:toll/interleukin-1 receptor domain-containing protein [Mastigocladus laminosus UU774]
MKDLFVSYASQDSLKAKELVSNLKEVQVSGWLDQADIATGEEISSVLRDSIRKASAVLVLISPASVNNRWVEFEVSAGEALGKTIIPVIISGENIEKKLPSSMADIMYIDARKRSLDEVVSEIKRAVNA